MGRFVQPEEVAETVEEMDDLYYRVLTKLREEGEPMSATVINKAL